MNEKYWPCGLDRTWATETHVRRHNGNHQEAEECNTLNLDAREDVKAPSGYDVSVKDDGEAPLTNQVKEDAQAEADSVNAIDGVEVPSIKEDGPIDRVEQGRLGQASEKGMSHARSEDREAEGTLGQASEEGMSLADALDEVATFNKRFIHHKNDCVHDAVALWIIHTYAMDKWNITPRLYINAPQAGAGKSTQGKVIASLSNNGIKVASSTPAYIFGRIAENKGAVTLLLDEADNIWAKGKDTSDLQALVNEGYEYGATVGRGNATDAGIKGVEYEAFCPVAIIGVKNSMIPNTTLSRCIDIKMTLPDNPKQLSRFLARKYQEEANSIRAMVAEASTDIPEFEEMEAPDGLSLRSWDIWEPLFIVAKTAGGDWPARVLKAARVMNNVEVVLSPAQKVLGMAHDYLRTPKKAKPTDIANHINALDEMFELTGQRVSYYLRQYGVESKKSNGGMWFYLEDVANAAQEWLGHTPLENPTLSYPDLPDTDAQAVGSPPNGDWKTNADGDGW